VFNVLGMGIAATYSCKSRNLVRSEGANNHDNTPSSVYIEIVDILVS
jgi:hypothetical protein